MNLALLGLDTSHGPAFARILKEDFSQHHLVGAWAGGSPQIPVSWGRVGKFTEEVRGLGVPIMPTPEAAAVDADAVLILNLNGDSHAPLLDAIARPGLKVFVDKPLAYSVSDAEMIFKKASAAGIDLFSASALRFLSIVQKSLLQIGRDNIRRLHLRAPLNPVAGVPHYHFYAIHSVEVLVTLLGPEVRTVKRITPGSECFRLEWQSGAEAELELTTESGAGFDLRIESQSGEVIALPAIEKSQRPRYRPLLEACLHCFETDDLAVRPNETLAILSILAQFQAESNADM
jgi:hypothetical protein